jgi:hypothetical protein
LSLLGYCPCALKLSVPAASPVKKTGGSFWAKASFIVLAAPAVRVSGAPETEIVLAPGSEETVPPAI